MLVSRIRIIKQQRSSLVNKTIDALKSEMKENAPCEKGCRAYSLAASLIRQQNHVDVLDILSEICSMLQRNANDALLYDETVHDATNDGFKKFQTSCMIATIMYVAHSPINKENYLPELARIYKIFTRKPIGQKLSQKRLCRRQQKSAQHNLAEVCPRVLSKLSEVAPSSDLINNYLNVFREHSALKKEKASLDNSSFYRKTRDDISFSRRTNVNNGKGTFPASNVSTTFEHHALSLLSPILPIYIFQPNPHLEIAFDVRTKNPLYVLEKIQRDSSTKPPMHQRPQFWEEKRLPPEYRSRLTHYARSGYDRGHLAPAADFTDEKEILDTFNLCNVSPQDHFMNISIWAKLERWCRRIAAQALTEKWGDTYLMTGPLWVAEENLQKEKKVYHYKYPAIKGTSNTLVQVPTHFFKILVVLREKVIKKFECFMVPNSKQKAESTLLETYVTSWDELQSLSGLQFFPSCIHVGENTKIL